MTFQKQNKRSIKNWKEALIGGTQIAEIIEALIGRTQTAKNWYLTETIEALFSLKGEVPGIYSKTQTDSSKPKRCLVDLGEEL